MKLSYRSVLSWVRIACAVLLTFWNDSSHFLPDPSIFAMLFVLLIYEAQSAGRFTVLQLVIVGAGFVLYAFPHLGSLIRGEDVSLVFFSLYLIIVRLFFQYQPHSAGRRYYWDSVNWGAATLAALALSLIAGQIWGPLFLSFFGLSVLFLDRACAQLNARRAMLYFLVGLIFAALLYRYSQWNGSGRLYVATLFALPVVILHHNHILRIKLWHMLLGVPLALLGSTAFRFGSLEPSNLGGESAGHHLTLMTELRERADVLESDIAELGGQLSLYFLNWFPRDVWPTKPIGIGLWFVDEYIGREGYSDGFSVSLGFWGEHIYLNPTAWIFSGVGVVLLSVLVFRGLQFLSGNSVAVLLMFQVNLVTLFWGGMASFGARVWWLVIPSLLFVIVERYVVSSVASSGSVYSLPRSSNTRNGRAFKRSASERMV